MYSCDGDRHVEGRVGVARCVVAHGDDVGTHLVVGDAVELPPPLVEGREVLHEHTQAIGDRERVVADRALPAHVVVRRRIPGVERSSSRTPAPCRTLPRPPPTRRWRPHSVRRRHQGRRHRSSLRQAQPLHHVQGICLPV